MGANAGQLPVTRGNLCTTDIARTHELLTEAYVGHRPRLARPDADFVYRFRGAAAGDIAVNRLHYLGTADTVAEPFDAVTTAVLFDGVYRVGTGSHRHRFGAGEALLVPLGAPLDVSWTRLSLQTVRFSLKAVTRVARHLGVEPVDFRFDSPVPVSAGMRNHWVATVGYLTRCFAGSDPAVGYPLVYAAVLNTLATAAVTVFPNTTMSVAHLAGPGRVPPAAVRRATAYIEAHAGEPITIDDIAAAAWLSVRGLQAAFARHCDTTPLGHLRRVRMEGAHRDLQAADPSRGDTVAAIARRWGSAAPGRFAVQYREIYGQSPSRTLRT